MSEASDLRERAIAIRSIALGFNDEASATMLEIAHDLEAMAAKLEAVEREEKKAE